MNDNEKTLDAYFAQDNSALPSNFSWLVMQRVMAKRLEAAQRQGRFYATLASIGCVIAGIGLLVLYSLYAGSVAVSLPKLGGLAAPVVLAFVLVVSLDLAVTLLRGRDSS